MSSRSLTELVYASIALAGVALELWSHRRRSKLPPLEQMLAWVMRTRMGRVGVMTGWVWIGLHYFAR